MLYMYCCATCPQAVSGQAIDRHLLGLKLIADENGIETPGLYRDVAYSRSLHFRLSSSQVPILCMSSMEYSARQLPWGTQKKLMTHF